MPLNPSILTFFAKYIEKELGIVYSEFNHYQLENRLDEIVRIVGLNSVEELHAKATAGMTSDIKQLLLDMATNNETSFFRDPKIFRAIQSSVFPTILKDGRKARIWSAACSFGQEPYTLSMLLQQYSEQVKAPVNAEIVATDISSKALERARSGRYSQLEVQRGLPAASLIKFFKKDDDNYWTVDPVLRAPIRFETLNLLSSFLTWGKLTMILCRNVLIYQSVENKIKIINKFTESLNSGGFLILGAGESLIGLSDAFESVKVDETLFYVLKANPLTLAA
ncbi:MAG: protein-glutamate O-methyltransferase CheR [Calothrix sp. SM1_5_4]|nr:protein-glutamate O-methyltransferase CheR [Calothrix sp. SM1_5_4]